MPHPPTRRARRRRFSGGIQGTELPRENVRHWRTVCMQSGCSGQPCYLLVPAYALILRTTQPTSWCDPRLGRVLI
eukprot:3697663-Alexandrium_andersonii.AAC.1